MTLFDIITRGKFFFDMAHTYLERSQQYDIRDPMEAIVTFGYKHLERQDVFAKNPEVLRGIRKAFSKTYENFEHNISREENPLVVVHGRRTIDQEMDED